MIPIILLSSTYLIYDSSSFTSLNYFVIFGFFILMYIFTIKPTYEIKDIIVEGVTIVFEPISLIGDYLKEVTNKISSKIKLSENAKKVLKSLIIVIPIVVIVLVLLSNADMIFDNIFASIFRKIKDAFFYKFFDNIIGKLILLIIMFVAIGVDLLYLLKDYSKKKNNELKSNFKIDTFTTKLLISILNIIYVVFDFIQIKSLMLHQVSSGFNYAEYARKGFFELMAVSVINIAIILISKKFENSIKEKDKKYINIMSLIMVFLTLIIIVSSFLRMNLYESAYGYTVLRLYVYVALITECIIMIPTVMYIFNSKVNIVKYYMIIFVGVYTIINFMNFDYLIAERNINRYYKNNKIDINYLENFHSDNVSLLIDLFNNTKDEDIKKSLNNYFVIIKKDFKDNSIFEYNISRNKAVKKLNSLKLKKYSDSEYYIDYFDKR